jgi:hypothetical protein
VAGVPAHIRPDTQTPAQTSAAAVARAGVHAVLRGTKCPLRTHLSRRERAPMLVTILNTVTLLPLDAIKQEYAQADRLANPWNTFQGTRPDKSLKSR